MKSRYIDRYIENPNKVNKFKLQEKNFKLEKLKFDYQIRCLSMKLFFILNYFLANEVIEDMAL